MRAGLYGSRRGVYPYISTRIRTNPALLAVVMGILFVGFVALLIGVILEG